MDETTKVLSHEDITRLRELAVTNGDDYLLAAVEDSMNLRKKVSHWCRKAHEERDGRREAEHHSNWLQTVFVEPMNKAAQETVRRDSEILRIVRDSSVKPDDKLAMIEELLTVE